MVKVSVVVPVYKVEDHLRQCLDCLAAQTYNNIEVITVDDGSPDSCGKICDEYAEKYSNFRVLHQENQGLSGARNNGVLIAEGELLTFVDSDDMVTKDYVEYLVSLREKYSADISIGGFKYQYENKELAAASREEKEYVMTASEALTRMNYGKGFSVFQWGKLYPTELVRRYPSPLGKLYEDLSTTYKMIGQCKKVVFGSRCIYFWMQRENSITRSVFDERHLYAITAAGNQLRYIEKHFPDAVPAAKARYMSKPAELFAIAMKSKDRYKYYKLLRSKLRFVGTCIKDKNVKKSMKLRCIAMKTGYLPSLAVFKAHDKLKELFI